VLSPGINSIGTLTINGNANKSGGVYQVDTNAQGQGDRVNVGGTASIGGVTVQVLAQPGLYAHNTTYTVLNAHGGITGAYAGISSNYAFLAPRSPTTPTTPTCCWPSPSPPVGGRPTSTPSARRSTGPAPRRQATSPACSLPSPSSTRSRARRRSIR